MKKISNKKPKFGYNLAKYSATKYLLDEFRLRKFPVIILRLYQTYGPHQDTNRLIPFVINECLEKKDFPCSHGKQYRDFIYVNDLILLISKCLKSNFIGEIFNVGSGKPVKVKNVINKIRNKIKNGNPNFGKLTLRKDEAQLIYPNINKVKKYFNWKPTTSLDNGLNKTINFFKKKKEKTV